MQEKRINCAKLCIFRFRISKIILLLKSTSKYETFETKNKPISSLVQEQSKYTHQKHTKFVILGTCQFQILFLKSTKRYKTFKTKMKSLSSSVDIKRHLGIRKCAYLCTLLCSDLDKEGILCLYFSKEITMQKNNNSLSVQKIICGKVKKNAPFPLLFGSRE